MDIIDTLDRFIEAARRVSKQRQLRAIERRLEKAMAKAFRVQGKAFLKEFGKLKEKFPPELPESEALKSLVQSVGRTVLREAITDAVLEPLFDKALTSSLKLFKAPLEAAVTASLASGAKALIGELGIKLSFSLKNPRAVAYLKDHGADLVKRIDETTRATIKGIVTQAVDNGWSYNRTALAIQERFKEFAEGKPQEHIASRAHLVAVTEAGEAYETGSFIVIQDLEDAGIEMEKSWSTMGDSRVSAGCLENEAEGWIPATQAHASGHLHPLRFPGCRCDELYRAKED